MDIDEVYLKQTTDVDGTYYMKQPMKVDITYSEQPMNVDIEYLKQPVDVDITFSKQPMDVDVAYSNSQSTNNNDHLTRSAMQELQSGEESAKKNSVFNNSEDMKVLKSDGSNDSRVTVDVSINAPLAIFSLATARLPIRKRALPPSDIDGFYTNNPHEQVMGVQQWQQQQGQQTSLNGGTNLKNMEPSLPKNFEIIAGGSDEEPDMKVARLITNNQVDQPELDAEIDMGRSDWSESSGRGVNPISNINTGDESTLSDYVKNEFRYSGNRSGNTEQILESEAQQRNQSNMEMTNLTETQNTKPETKQLTLDTIKSEYRQRYEVYKRLCRVSRAKDKEIALLESERERVKKELLSFKDCYTQFLSSSYPNAESNLKVELTEAEKSSANQMCFAGKETKDKESDNRTSPTARPASSDVDTVVKKPSSSPLFQCDELQIKDESCDLKDLGSNDAEPIKKRDEEISRMNEVVADEIADMRKVSCLSTDRVEIDPIQLTENQHQNGCCNVDAISNNTSPIDENDVFQGKISTFNETFNQEFAETGPTPSHDICKRNSPVKSPVNDLPMCSDTSFVTNSGALDLSRTSSSCSPSGERINPTAAFADKGAPNTGSEITTFQSKSASMNNRNHSVENSATIEKASSDGMLFTSENAGIQFRRNTDDGQLRTNQEHKTSPSNFANVYLKQGTNVRNAFDTCNRYFDKHTSEPTELVIQHSNPPTDRRSGFRENKFSNTYVMDHMAMDQSDPLHNEGYTASKNPGVMKADSYFGTSNHHAHQSMSELKNGTGTGVLGEKAGPVDARVSGYDRNAVYPAENYKWNTQRGPITTATRDVCPGGDCLCSPTRPSKGVTFDGSYVNFLSNHPHSENFASNDRLPVSSVERLERHRHPNPFAGQMEMSYHHGEGKNARTSVPIPHRDAPVSMSIHTSLIRPENEIAKIQGLGKVKTYEIEGAKLHGHTAFAGFDHRQIFAERENERAHQFEKLQEFVDGNKIAKVNRPTNYLADLIAQPDRIYMAKERFRSHGYHYRNQAQPTHCPNEQPTRFPDACSSLPRESYPLPSNSSRPDLSYRPDSKLESLYAKNGNLVRPTILHPQGKLVMPLDELQQHRDQHHRWVIEQSRLQDNGVQNPGMPPFSRDQMNRCSTPRRCQGFDERLAIPTGGRHQYPHKPQEGQSPLTPPNKLGQLDQGPQVRYPYGPYAHQDNFTKTIQSPKPFYYNASFSPEAVPGYKPPSANMHLHQDIYIQNSVPAAPAPGRQPTIEASRYGASQRQGLDQPSAQQRLGFTATTAPPPMVDATRFAPLPTSFHTQQQNIGAVSEILSGNVRNSGLVSTLSALHPNMASLRQREQHLPRGVPPSLKVSTERDFGSSKCPEYVCETCRKPSKFVCSACKNTAYCSIECQTTAWLVRHSAVCRPY